MATHWDELDVLILDGMGGCPFVIDPKKPHMGGNMRGGDAGTDFSADLWPWLIDRYGMKYMLDVGCAEGHALRFFQDRGVKVLGLEGLWQNARRCGVPVIVHDLHSGPCRVEGVDFIWCCDVVEHIDEACVPNILGTFKYAKRVALCHGTEEHEKAGWHHVNNRSAAYWAERMQSIGFVIDQPTTDESRAVTKGRSYWPDTGCIWENKEWPRNK